MKRKKLNMFNEIYWLTRIVAFGSVLEVIIIIHFVIIFFVISDGFYYNEKETRMTLNVLKYLTITFLFSVVLWVMIPDKEDLVMIYGWEALKSEEAQSIFKELKKRI